MQPQQSAQITASVRREMHASNAEEIGRFVASQLRNVIQGDTVPQERPPPIQLYCRHLTQASVRWFTLYFPILTQGKLDKGAALHHVNRPYLRHFLEHGRRNATSAALAVSYRHIPYRLRHHIFPIFNPASMDFLVFWEIPSQGRHGHCLVTGLTLGAIHAPLRELIEEAESAKVKRSMYAETQRERAELLETIRRSEWNGEADPLVVTSHDGQMVRHDFSHGYVGLALARRYS